MGIKEMKVLEEYREKFGVKEVANSMGERRRTEENSIVFPNGWVASIVENKGMIVHNPDGTKTIRMDSDKKYSVAMCDYDGYFDWEMLNEFGAIKGCLYCDTELEIIIACETIRRLQIQQICIVG